MNKHDDRLLDWIRFHITENGLSDAHKKECWNKFGVLKSMVVIDSSGFTSTTSQSGILHFLSLLVQIRDMVCPILAQFDAQNVRCEADNFFAEFDAPLDALNACVAVHHAVLTRNLCVDKSFQYSLCSGIGYGAVLNAGYEGVFGDEMNIASKLGEDVANADELLLSAAAYEQIQNATSLHFASYNCIQSNTEINYYKTTVELPSQSLGL